MRPGYRVCYGCGEDRVPPERISSLCEPCTIEAAARKPHHTSDEPCEGCGITFYNDWERLMHDTLGKHRYRAWRGVHQ